MFKRFGLYLLEKRYNAVWVVLLCASLPLFLIPTGSIAVLIVGLVTLHKGAREGFFLLCWMLLPSIASALLGDYTLLLTEGVGKGIPIWLMASVLTTTASWASVVELGAVYGVVVIGAAHLIVPDLQAWWSTQLLPHTAQAQAAIGLTPTPEGLKQSVEKASQFATGMVVAIVFIIDLLLLLLSRGWQAALFNPGGLGREWRQLRLGYVYSAVVLVVTGLALLSANSLQDVLPVLLAPFVFAGLSLIHAKLPTQKNVRVPVLIGVYTALLFLPYLCVVLVLVAMVDSWYDFRDIRHRRT